MTFKIIKNMGDLKPDFLGTSRAGSYLAANNGNYGNGPNEGEKLLRDLYTNVFGTGTGSPTIMIDASGGNAHDSAGEPVSKLHLQKDESGRKYKMAMPEGDKINTKYLEGILKVLEDKFDNGSKHTDQDMKNFMLGIVLLTKCR